MSDTMNSALMFVPGAGLLIVLGPLAARHLPKYEQLVRAGSYLVVVHGTEEDVARAQQTLTEAGSTDVRRHDEYRGSRIGPIAQVREDMPVIDAAGERIGKVSSVKMGDPEAVTTQGEQTDDGEPHVGGELRDRLLRIGFIKIDRKGFLRPDAYAAADQIDRVDDDSLHLSVKDTGLLRQL